MQKENFSADDLRVIHKKFDASGPTLRAYQSVVPLSLRDGETYTCDNKKQALERLVHTVCESNVSVDINIMLVFTKFLRDEMNMWPFALFVRKRISDDENSPPRTSTGARIWYTLNFSSKEDVGMVYQQLDISNKLQAKKIYEFLMMDAMVGSTSLGWLYEARQHFEFTNGKTIPIRLITAEKTNSNWFDNYMSSIASAPARKLRKVKGTLLSREFNLDTKLHATQGPERSEIFSSIEELVSYLKKLDDADLKKLDGAYFQPGISNQAAFDALTFRIIVVGTEIFIQLVVIQYTVGRTHPIKAIGLQKLWKALPARFKYVPPIFVFIIPKRLEDCYKGEKQTVQKSEDTSKATLDAQHPKNWAQAYDLVDEDTMYHLNE